MLSVKFAGNFFVNLLGTWHDGGGRAYPIGEAELIINRTNDKTNKSID